MNAEKIELDFRAAMAKADELEAVGKELMQTVNGDYEDTLQMLAGNWKGVNAEAYLRKGGDLGNQMRRTARSVMEAAEEIRRTARRIYAAEMAAVRIAETKNYT